MPCKPRDCLIDFSAFKCISGANIWSNSHLSPQYFSKRCHNWNNLCENKTFLYQAFILDKWVKNFLKKKSLNPYEIVSFNNPQLSAKLLTKFSKQKIALEKLSININGDIMSPLPNTRNQRDQQHENQCLWN